MPNGDDVPLCPPWWPRLIWDLHFFPRPHGPNPVNYPAAMDDLMAAIGMHTFSYLLLDQEAGQKVRELAVRQLTGTVSRLDELHDQGQAMREAR
jgi:hypothetical protein